MPRYIDAEQKITVTYYEEEVADWFKETKTIDDFLSENVDEEIPTADVVEVVRCKDCKHYNKDYFDNFYEKPICLKTYCCDGSHKEVNDDDFCSMGERKDN